MNRRNQGSGLRIGHLIGAVAASAFVLALSMFPQDYALLMVAAAGVLMIVACLVVAVVNRARARRARLVRRKSTGRVGLFP